MSPFQANFKIIKPEIMCPGTGNLVKARDLQWMALRETKTGGGGGGGGLVNVNVGCTIG